MSGLFGGGGKSQAWYQNQAQKTANKTAKKQKKQINKGLGKASNILGDATASLSDGLPAVNLGGTGTGLGIGIDASGNVNANRSAESSSLMSSLMGGLSTDEASYNDLLSSLSPGFGKVTEARRSAIENARVRAVGDLRDSLSRRRLAGSSFANDTVRGAEADFARQTADADAQSYLEELSATTQLIQARTAARTKTIEDAFSQVNFETSVGAQLLGQSRNLMSQADELLADLAKTNATLQVDAAKAKAGNTTTLGGTYLNTLPDFAKLQAEGDAGAGKAVGTLGGGLIGAYFGGTEGAKVGAQIGSGTFG